jgi:hypothetical protein
MIPERAELTRHEVQKGSQGQQEFSTDPLHSTELDTVGVFGKVNVKHGEFLKNVNTSK